MKKTVGELIAEQAKKESITNPLPEDIFSQIKAIAETQRKNIESYRKPFVEDIKRAKLNLESFVPRLDRMAEINEIVLENYILPENRIQNVRIINSEDMGVKSNTKVNRVVVASYPLPKNATWEGLSIQFLDGHIVKVSYQNMKSQKFDFKDMGFMNTKTNNPDLKWRLLKTIADFDGALTNSNWDRKFGRNVKYELNEGLKNFFCMDSNPIPHYTKRNGYKPLFILKKVL